MAKYSMKLLLSFLLLLLATTSLLLLGALHSSSMRPFLRNSAGTEGDTVPVVLHGRVLLTTRNTPMGFPPPPAMMSPPPPGY